MKNLINIIFVLISIVTFAQIKLSDKQVVFEKDIKILLDIKPYNEYERYTPNKTEVKNADEIIINAIKSKNLNLDNFYRQYVGLIKNGKKIIFLNASCKKENYFETNTLYPKGGGKCYFQGFIDLTDNKIIDELRFNAPR